MSGPFKDSKILNYIPGPGRYESNKSTLENRSSSMRQKLPDVSTRHLLKVAIQLGRIQDQAPMEVNRWAKTTTT